MVSRGPIRSVSVPPTMPPSTAPTVKTASAVPACTAEKPRVVRKRTRKTCRKAPSRLTKIPTSSALAAGGASRHVAQIPTLPASCSVAVTAAPMGRDGGVRGSHARLRPPSRPLRRIVHQPDVPREGDVGCRPGGGGADSGQSGGHGAAAEGRPDQHGGGPPGGGPGAEERGGVRGLPSPERGGGGAQPYEVYLQVVEELAAAWLAVGLGVSVHTLACFPTAAFGSDAQRDELLPGMLGGDLLGAYCLSEPASGSDAAALTTRAVRDGDDYVVDGVKAWVTHGGHADFYNLMVRTGGPGSGGISCLLAPADTAGLLPQPAERKMGMSSSPTAGVVLDGARVPADRLLGAEGQGFRIALAALDGGRLGIAACAVGLAQNALDVAVAWAGERRQFGRPLLDFQGLSFLLADMATGVEAGRALYLGAARKRDRGEA